MDGTDVKTSTTEATSCALERHDVSYSIAYMLFTALINHHGLIWTTMI